MRPESFEFLKAMEETPSVSGFEQPVGRVIRKRMEPFADEITTDLHGNTMLALNPKGKPRVMLAGHYGANVFVGHRGLVEAPANKLNAVVSKVAAYLGLAQLSFGPRARHEPPRPV